jgi:hypothetical protein
MPRHAEVQLTSECRAKKSRQQTGTRRAISLPGAVPAENIFEMIREEIRRRLMA